MPQQLNNALNIEIEKTEIPIPFLMYVRNNNIKTEVLEIKRTKLIKYCITDSIKVNYRGRKYDILYGIEFENDTRLVICNKDYGIQNLMDLQQLITNNTSRCVPASEVTMMDSVILSSQFSKLAPRVEQSKIDFENEL